MEIPWLTIFSFLGTVVTTASLVYAIKTNKEKEKFEKLVRDKLSGIAGNVWKARQSAHWSDKNFARARNETIKLSECDEKSKILEHLHNGARDAVAAERMLSNLLGEVVSMQKGMFNTDIISHPDITSGKIMKNDNLEE
jgi:hypothetical protein